MTYTAIYIAPYALDHVVSLHCRYGLAVVEMDFWWIELCQDYSIVLIACNDNLEGQGTASL